MRAPIWLQLALLFGSVALVALVVVAAPTWVYVQGFISKVEIESLVLAASLYAAKIDSQLQLLNTITNTIATRILLQQSLVNYYAGNATASTVFKPTVTDLQSALATSSLTGLLQARIYSRNQTGEDSDGLVSVTGAGFGTDAQNIPLPYLTPNGTRVRFGDDEFGYPPSLYPNITYQNLGYANPYIASVPAVSASAFPGVLLSDSRGLLLGPLIINESFALISLTIPIRSLNVSGFILGYMTLVAAANTFLDIETTRNGLGSTGVALLITPDNPSNRFAPSQLPSNKTYLPPKGSFANNLVRYVFQPVPVAGQTDRHGSTQGSWSLPFALSQYPAILSSYSTYNSELDNAQALLTTTNEHDYSVAIGVARPQTTLVDWAIVIEKAHSEANEPILTLRNILLGCAFGTAGLVLLISIPCAYISVRPIRRLKLATERSITIPGYDTADTDDVEPAASSGGTLSSASAKKLFKSIRRKFGKLPKPLTQAEIENHRRAFKIPGKVKERKHIITDEVTELTEVYNRMTDELVKQYTSLEHQVAERTRELEISKLAAEAANESKTLFIANISHELKTPLNGIMGICAVCMEENDILHIQHSLKTLYRSGELLLHLLDDLLSFSKHQISQEIKLEYKEFRLGEIRSQILSIFDKQARDNKIDLDVAFHGPRTGGLDFTSSLTVQQQHHPARLRDVFVLGDQHRILQVIINLLSNSLKFTATGGRVQVRIRWGDELEPDRKSPNQVAVTHLTDDVALSEKTDSQESSLHFSASDTPGLTSKPDLTDSNGKTQPSVTTKSDTIPPSPLNETTQLYMFTFEVEDTGRGIPQDMKEKIFEPFVQVDSSFSKEFGGTGLGLSICSQLAKLMKGTISVESIEGVGSTFRLRIPLKYISDRVPSTRSESTRPISRAPSADSSTNSGGGKSSHRNSLSSVLAHDTDATTSHGVENHRCDIQPRLVGLSTPFFPPIPNPNSTKSTTPTTVIATTSTNAKQMAIQQAKADKAKIASSNDSNKIAVLVADDNATNVEVVRRMLKLEKINNVAIARDGREAYEIVKASMEQNRRFDVIFMDVQMPNIDGIQSTKLIRNMGYAAPIVALTAFSEESNRKACMESGMDEFLAKPIRRSALKSVLTKFATIYEEKG